MSAVNGAGQGSESSVVYESDGGFSEVDNETVTVTVTEPAPTSATTDEPTETTTPSSSMLCLCCILALYVLLHANTKANLEQTNNFLNRTVVPDISIDINNQQGIKHRH